MPRGRSLHSHCDQQSSQHISTLSCFGPKLRLKPELASLHPTSTVDACVNDVLVRIHFTGIGCLSQLKQHFKMMEGLAIIVEATIGRKIAAIHSPCRMDF